MLLKIVKTTELPFGKRILGRGAHGAAVRQLQEILTDQGFYAEPVDGNFGILTEEAVMLLQKAFQLKVDGVVGPATYNVLQRLNHQPSRIIYTVKKGDRLTEISRQFGVTVTAWKRIADPRREIKRIYPGMKLLLYQKALLTWEENLKMPVTTVKVSGTVNSGLRLDSTGAINPDPVNLEPDSYYLIQADPEIWEQCLASKKYCQKVAVKLQALQQYKWGVDLRAAPFDTYFDWGRLLKRLLKPDSTLKMPVVLVPLPVDTKGVKTRFWLNLAGIGELARLIMVEPELDTVSPENFIAAARQLEHCLARFARWGALNRILLVADTQGWNWSGPDSLRRVSFQEAKLIQALHSRVNRPVLSAGFQMVEYRSQGKPQCLVYRDLSAWRDLLAQLIKYNFTGIVIRDFAALGTAGPELIAGSFAVLPGEQLG